MGRPGLGPSPSPARISAAIDSATWQRRGRGVAHWCLRLANIVVGVTDTASDRRATVKRRRGNRENGSSAEEVAAETVRDMMLCMIYFSHVIQHFMWRQKLWKGVVGLVSDWEVWTRDESTVLLYLHTLSFTSWWTVSSNSHRTVLSHLRVTFKNF